ncbi:orotidine-5'-phosphate decarboxylase [Alkalibacillus aidingensis]|uniref:orotidine-5'-phosphate decarboxylase n=1 Tax=Alkalibacillus aidingensis TaxID=2747607 RepID=UPI00166113CB|nr:orotidine-5'-phosphate decarboxylase [Alkalibacillus aidingensis]
MCKSVYLALDFHSLEETKLFLETHELAGIPVKVGMQLFYAEGHQVLDYLKSKDHPIFLDLKLHDIPNTVKQAIKSLSDYELDFINVHSAGGRQMIEAAKEGIEASGNQTKLLAVTQLTSMDDHSLKNDLLIHHSMEDTVKHYAKISQISGVDGVVCSVREVEVIKSICGETFITVCPGIRLSNDHPDDQKRIATPSDARKVNSDCIVVGRSVTKACQPNEAYQRMLKEWSLSYVKE